MKESIRTRRYNECFSKIDKSILWYNRLTDSQKKELEEWYEAWLDVTETMQEPKKPSFID